MFIIEMAQDLWSDGLPSRIMLLIAVVSVATIVILVVMLSIWAVDSWFQTKHDGIGIVVGKEFVKSHTATTFIQSGKVLIPVTTTYPDEWYVSILVGEKQDDISVSHGFYNNAKNGDIHDVVYHIGRISGNLYLDEIISNEKAQADK